MQSLIPLFAAITPFVLWPIELFLPYPHIIEELAKASLVYPLLGIGNKSVKYRLALAVGFLFAVSEGILYIFNISRINGFETLLLRLAITIPLHTFTTIVITFFGLKSKMQLLFGVIIAMLIHYFFNTVIGSSYDI